MVIYLPAQSVDDTPALDELTPREIVRELDKHVVGQQDANTVLTATINLGWVGLLPAARSSLPAM